MGTVKTNLQHADAHVQMSNSDLRKQMTQLCVISFNKFNLKRTEHYSVMGSVYIQVDMRSVCSAQFRDWTNDGGMTSELDTSLGSYKHLSSDAGYTWKKT